MSALFLPSRKCTISKYVSTKKRKHVIPKVFEDASDGMVFLFVFCVMVGLSDWFGRKEEMQKK